VYGEILGKEMKFNFEPNGGRHTEVAGRIIRNTPLYEEFYNADTVQVTCEGESKYYNVCGIIVNPKKLQYGFVLMEK